MIGSFDWVSEFEDANFSPVSVISWFLISSTGSSFWAIELFGLFSSETLAGFDLLFCSLSSPFSEFSVAGLTSLTFCSLEISFLSDSGRFEGAGDFLFDSSSPEFWEEVCWSEAWTSFFGCGSAGKTSDEEFSFLSAPVSLLSFGGTLEVSAVFVWLDSSFSFVFNFYSFALTF